MIYNDSYFKEELSKSFMSEKNRLWRLIAYSLVVTAVAFIISTVFASLQGTIFTEGLSMFSNINAFSLLQILNVIASLFLIFYLFIYFNNMTFNERVTNRMYMLIKIGNKPIKIIFSRLASSLVFALTTYVVSFTFALAACLLFSYPLNLNAVPSIFIIGVVLITSIDMTIQVISLYIEKRVYCVLIFVILLALASVYAALGGFIDVCSSIEKISSFKLLFGLDSSLFLVGLIIYSLVLVVLFVIKSYTIVQTYYAKEYSYADVETISFKTKKVIRKHKDRSLVYRRIILSLSFFFASIILITSLALNSYLIYMSSRTIDSSIALNSEVALIYREDDLLDDIHANDYIVFLRVDEEYQIEVNDIVYYYSKESKKTEIKKVMSSEEGYYILDITNYEEGQKSLEERVERENIKGVNTKVNRYFGAVLILNESIVGKFLLIGIPVVYLIFYKRIKVLGKAYLDEEKKEIN